MRELLYNDSVQFSFDAGQHLYSVKKLVDKTKKVWTTPIPVTGVTTITGILAKPALPGWAAGLAADFMRDNTTSLDQLASLALEARRQHIMAANKGKATGSVGHALVEALLLKEKVVLPTEPEAKKAAGNIVKAFKDFQTAFKPKLVAVEKACYSLAHDYAGKFDLLCEINGKLYLVDFKTNNTSRYAPEGIYPDMFAQLGGYIQLIKEQLNVQIDDAMIVNLSKSSGEYKIKGLGEMGVPPSQAVLYFLNALGLYNINKDVAWKLKN